VPINDSLIRDTVLVVQNLKEIRSRQAGSLGDATYFENLGECFDDASVLITIHLNNVYKGNFSLGTIAEWLEYWGVFLCLLMNL